MIDKPVNTVVQCLATLFSPVGLYAFKRIKKLRLGIIIYAICYTLYIIATIYPLKVDASPNVTEDTIGLTSFFSVGLAILSFALPIIFMRKWSIAWNEAIAQKTHSIDSAKKESQEPTD